MFETVYYKRVTTSRVKFLLSILILSNVSHIPHYWISALLWIVTNAQKIWLKLIVDAWQIVFEIYEPIFHSKSCLEIRLEMRNSKYLYGSCLFFLSPTAKLNNWTTYLQLCPLWYLFSGLIVVFHCQGNHVKLMKQIWPHNLVRKFYCLGTVTLT